MRLLVPIFLYLCKANFKEEEMKQFIFNKLLVFLSCISVSFPLEASQTKHDSLFSISSAYRCNLTSLDSSLTILQTMRDRKMAPAWELDIAEGDMYRNVRQIQKALPCYEKALAGEVQDDSIRMAIYSRMMDAYDIIHDDDQLMYYIYLEKELAEKMHSTHYAALAEFMTGKHLHYQGKRQEGYEICRNALEVIERSTHPFRTSALCSFYENLLCMHVSDKQFNEALRYTALQEEMTRNLLDQKSVLAAEHPLRRVYAIRASFLSSADRMVEADAAYMLWKGADGGNAVDDVQILDYLLKSQRYEEALMVIRNSREFLASMGDDISFWNLIMLFKEVQAKVRIQRYDETENNLGEAIRIVDSLRVRACQTEMMTFYQLLEKEKEVHQRNLMINWIASLLILVVLVVAIVIYYTRIIRQRNRVLTQVVQELDAYRHVKVDQTEKMVSPVSEDVQTFSTPVEKPLDEDERLFVEMDSRVTREQLFLQPDLDREKLMHLIGLDKNRFGRMMSKYASNASVYINTKRVEYGAQLLVNHPEYTIASIAEMCGMRNTVTFNRTFKEVFGVTPSEYRTS